GLEDKIMPYIAAFARQEYNVEVSIVDRRYVTYPDGRHDEINIYAEGVKGGEGVLLVGECKARPSKKDVDRIAAVVKRLKAHLGLPIYTFMVGYTYTPDVERYLREKYPEIRPVKSFVFDMKYARTLVS
ncbi:MAG: hypothetical protein N2Z74_02725, partial [Syntrophales bacterium]|nr:hypothetical protein [Syntrophales bacterium]